MRESKPEVARPPNGVHVVVVVYKVSCAPEASHWTYVANGSTSDGTVHASDKYPSPDS